LQGSQRLPLQISARTIKQDGLQASWLGNEKDEIWANLIKFLQRNLLVIAELFVWFCSKPGVLNRVAFVVR
jgi:hypothetical protein